MNPTEISLELRASAPRAPEALRQRVAAIAPAEPERRGRLLRLPVAPRKQAAFALAAVVAVAVGGALVTGIVHSSSHKSSVQRFSSEKEINNGASAGGGGSNAARAAASPSALQRQKALDRAAPIPSGSRLQDYEVSMTVRVKDQEALSNATVKAMRWTRSLGGYVARVSYDTPSAKSGES